MTGYGFGVQKDPIFGTYGEFTVGSESSRIKAQFLLTKIKPGSEGSWENSLASHMVPWREIFDIEELTFDELLQRDLDDSRVAHDLIPYLLGESGASARFFPPILAVLVPKNTQQSGIDLLYPTPSFSTSSNSGEADKFGDLFEFEKVKIGDEVSPLGCIRYNRHKSAFIIVDGQHRAMAILALHRQLTNGWSGNRYASYYSHLEVSQTEINHIELPVCVVFFPTLYPESDVVRETDINLVSVCREIFLIVNKNAKPVSQSRELLLDDDDLAACMMRKTLSKLKKRGESEDSIARIYSFSFGDSVSEAQHRKTEVVAGQLEYTSAVALHKMQAAVSFGVPGGFDLIDTQDITDGRRTQNSERAASILIGTNLEKWSSLSRRSGRSHSREDIAEAVDLLSELTNHVILSLFDKFKPFTVHNKAMRSLRTQITDPSAQGDPIQRKCYSLLFEGSGVRSVFEAHINRLDERQRESTIKSDYVTNQLNDAKGAASALQRHEEVVKKRRAANFFGIDYDKLFGKDSSISDSDRKELLSKAKTIFDTVSTQAFQMGFLMAVHSAVELMVSVGVCYEDRIKILMFVTDLYIEGLNSYFSEKSDVTHKTLKGLVNEKRVKVFEVSGLGLRGLLSQSVKELNERQWVFFRYAILEMVHSDHSCSAIKKKLNEVDEELRNKYRQCLPELASSVVKLREDYVDSAVNTKKNSSEFKQKLQVLEAGHKGEGKSITESQELIKQYVEDVEAEVRQECQENLIASLGNVASGEEIYNKFQ